MKTIYNNIYQNKRIIINIFFVHKSDIYIKFNIYL